MTNSLQPFGRAFGNPPLALAQHRLVEAALRFVDDGLSDPYTPHKTAPLATLGLLVQNRMLDMVAGGGIVPDGRRLAQVWRKGAWDEALPVAYKALLEAFNSTASMYFGRIAPPWLGLGDDATEIALATEVTGFAPSDEPTESDPVRQAYEMARYNTLRCEQRIALLHLLGGIVRPPNLSTLNNAAAQAEFEAASRQLWVSHSLHLSRMLAFGTLLGGEYLERNKQLVKALYGEGMSVIELTQVDGRVPGRWRTVDEDALRKAIAQA